MSHTLILLRHGQSTWNLENLFTGWTDVGLKQAASVSRAMFDTLFDQICSYDPCPIIQGNVLMYRDSHHLSETFAQQLQPSMEGILGRALAATGDGGAGSCSSSSSTSIGSATVSR